MSMNNFNVGDIYKENWRPTVKDIENFSKLSGDYNPIHNDLKFSLNYGFNNTLVHGNLTCVQLSRMIGMSFPGNGTLILEQNLSFPNPVYPNDYINFELKVDSVNNELGIIILKVKANKKSSERASSELTVLRGKVICKKL